MISFRAEEENLAKKAVVRKNKLDFCLVMLGVGGHVSVGMEMNQRICCIHNNACITRIWPINSRYKDSEVEISSPCLRNNNMFRMAAAVMVGMKKARGRVKEFKVEE